ncbi:MAG: hypothetical protein K6F50_00525 [Kiritimatiellae bacterium]|nr:hypothetical protein [Kiritimatiellia bacterium]
MKKSIVSTAVSFWAAIAPTGAFADIYWTGAGTEATKYWDDAANWTGESGNYVIRTAEMQNAPVEVNFRTAASITTGFWIENALSGVVTFKAPSTDYGLAMSGTDMHVGGGGGNGALVIDGGTYHFANDLFVGYAKATGNFTLKSGRVETQYWMPMGDGDGGTGNVVVEDGELIVGYRDGNESNNSRLEMGRGANSTATFLQLGGTVSAQGDGTHAGDSAVSIGEAANSTAVYTISNGTCIARSKYVCLASGSGSTGTLNIHGGTVETLGVTKGSGSAYLNFDGGTLKAKGADTIIAAEIATTVGSNGGAIDSDYDVTVASPISGSFEGSLVKKGTGALTLTGGVAGLFTVEGGSLTTPGGATYTTGSVALASGISTISGKPQNTPALTVEANSYLAIEPFCEFGEITLGAGSKIIINDDGSKAGTDHAVVSWTNLVLPSGASAEDFFTVTVLGEETAWSIENNSIVISASSTTWTGAAGDGLFNTAGNWSGGVPGATMEAVFTNSTEVTLNANDSHPFAKLTLGNNAHVTFKAPTMDNYPAINPGAIDGAGTIELYRCGLVPSAGVTVPSTISFTISNDGEQTLHDSWLQGRADGALTIEGPVTVENFLCLYEYVNLNGKVELKDGSSLAMDAFNTGRSASSTVSEVFVDTGNTALVNHKGLGSILKKTGAGVLELDLTGYDELVMEGGTTLLTSNEGPSYYFTFTGGALGFGYAMNWFDELVNRINNSEGHTAPVKIDTELDVTLNTALGSANTTNGFEKLGGYTLTLSSAPAWTGDTTVSQGKLVVPAGAAIPGTLSIAAEATLGITVDSNTWLAGYTGTLFAYGALAEGLTLSADNISLEGLSGGLEFELDISESGVVKAKISGDQLVWNGGSGAWSSTSVWKSSETGEGAAWESGKDAVFSGVDMTLTGEEIHTVTADTAITAGSIYSTAGTSKGYRVEGAALVADTLTQSGDGSFTLANESFETVGTVSVSAGSLAIEGTPSTFGAGANVTGGELVLDGASLTGLGIVNDATIRATGTGLSTIAQAVTGNGTIAIDEGASLIVANQELNQYVTGAGTLLVTNGWFTINWSKRLANFQGTIRLADGGILHERSEFNNDLKSGNVYPLGYNSKITFAGGTLEGFYNNNNTVIQSALHMEDGTTSYLNNTHQRGGAGNNMWLFGALTGSGKLVFWSIGRQTHLYGNATDFHGEMDLVGGLFQFMNEVAAGSNSVWNCKSANNYDILNGAGTTIRFGAMNVPESGANVYVANAGAIVEIGAKADSVINGAFIGSEFTLSKVGETSLIVNGDASNANVNVTAGAFGGTTTIKSLTVADGAKIAFQDLSDYNVIYEGPTVLSEPQWTKLPEILNAKTDRGRWLLNVTEETVTPEEGDAYTVWRLSATFRKNGFAITVR